MIFNLENDLEKLKGISIILVSKESCANCYSMLPILSTFVKNREDGILHHLWATSSNEELLKKWQIDAFPTILVCFNDRIEARCRGYQPQEIITIWLDTKIEEIKKKYQLS